jgi:putative hemin transport protein
MVFVGNPGMIQIHTGPVSNLKPMGPWFNVLDEAFNLHLREDHIDSAWVVSKPTEDGIVTSLELFSRDGTLIATLFGKRKPGQPEDLAWRDIVTGMIEKEAA